MKTADRNDTLNQIPTKMKNIRRLLTKEDNELLMLRLVWSSISMEDYTSYIQTAAYEQKELIEYTPATFELASYLDTLSARN